MTDTRQRVWDFLRSTDTEVAAANLSCKIQADQGSVSRYLSSLKLAGYVVKLPGPHWKLIKNTGPIAPKLNTRGEGRDYNLEPAMSGEELDLAIKASGLSIRQWAIANGLGDGVSTRIREMISGKRPVGRTIEKLLRD